MSQKSYCRQRMNNRRLSNFNKLVRLLRIAMNLNQTAFGNKVGVSRWSVWAWETRNIHPHPRHIARINELWDQCTSVNRQSKGNY